MLCHPPAGLAEKADRDKPLNIDADRMTADDAKQLSVFEGRVVMTKGTMQLHADRVTVRQDSEGNQYGVATGNPATFRQKRDGLDEWVDGEAQRIEYDSKVERVELFDRARLRREQDEVRGNYISYDSKTEFFRVQSTKEGSAPTSGDAPLSSRVRAVLQPKSKDKTGVAATPAPAPLDLKPAPDISNPRPE